MTTLADLRARAERIQEEYERQHAHLFRGDGQPRYSPTEHAERLRELQRERSRQLDELIAELRRLVAEAEQEISLLEDGDPTTLLSAEELAAAAAKKPFIDDDVWAMSEGELASKLRTVLAGEDRPSIFAYWRSGEARYRSIVDSQSDEDASAGLLRGGGAAVGPEGLREALDELRHALRKPEKLGRLERARQTIEAAVGVELLAGNLREGAATAAGAWANRRMRSA